MKKVTRHTTLVLMLIILAATTSSCGFMDVEHKQLQQPETVYRAASLSIVELADSVRPAEESVFEKNLSELLLKAGFEFNQPSDLTISYTFTTYEPGNRFLRWLTAGISGSGTLEIAVEYQDSDGQSIAKTSTNIVIKGGKFGGDFKTAIKTAAEKIAEHTVSHFQ